MTRQTRTRTASGTGMWRRLIAAVAMLMAVGALAPAPIGTGRVAHAAVTLGERRAGVTAAMTGLSDSAGGTRRAMTVQQFGNLNNPQGVATDGHFNLFIADTGNKRVVEEKTMGGGMAGSGGMAVIASGLNAPTGVAVDQLGNVYIGDSGANTVVKAPSGGGSQMTLPGTELKGPSGVAVDSQGNVYIADTGNDRVVEVHLQHGGFGKQITIAANLKQPAGVAVGSQDEIYIADTGNNRVIKILGDSQVVLASGLNKPQGVEANGADLFGNTDTVYIADTGSNRILEASLSGGAPTVVSASNLNAPIGLALDGAGGLFVANSGGAQVVDVALPTSGQLASTGGGPTPTPSATPAATPAITATVTPAAFGGPAIDADDAVQAQVGPGETQALSVVGAPGSLVRAAIVTSEGYPKTAMFYRADAHGHFYGTTLAGVRRVQGRRIAYIFGFFHAQPYHGRGCALLAFTVPPHGALGPATMPVEVVHPNGRVTHLSGQLGAHFTVVIDPKDKPGSLHPTSPAQLAVIARKACLGQL